MADLLDVLARWGALDGHGKVSRRQNKPTRKLYRDKPETDDYEDSIAMEDAASKFEKVKKQEDRIEQDKKIRADIRANKAAQDKKEEPEDTSPPDVFPGLAELGEEAASVQEQVDKKRRKQAMMDQIEGRVRDDNGKIRRPSKQPVTDSEVQQAYGGDGNPDAPLDGVELDPAKAPMQSEPPTVAEVVLPEQQVASDTFIEKPFSTDSIAGNTPVDFAKAPELNPLTEEQTPPQEIAVAPSRQPEATIQAASLQGNAPKQVPQATKQEAPNVPLMLDTPVSEEQLGIVDDKAALNNEMSGMFREATRKDISLFGAPIPKASDGYDAAENVLNTIQTANKGLVDAPYQLRRLGGFLFMGYDKIAGTDLYSKHEATTNAMESFTKQYTDGFTKEPDNVAERAFYALGASVLPIPGAQAAKTTGGMLRQVLTEAVTPGTFVNPTKSLAATYAASIPATALLNEGMYQTFHRLDELRKINPPVPNSKGDLEPPTTVIAGSEARELQRKVDASAARFIPEFAQASYADGLIAGVAGIAAVGLAIRTGRRLIHSPVANTTIRDPSVQTPDLSPRSATTAGEALRTMGQDSTYVLQSQARRAGNVELAQDIPTMTRGGVAARMEFMQDTGTIETPSFNAQLTTSPKVAIEHYNAMPRQAQQDFDWAMATLDQADNAGINKAFTMPAQGDVARANQILALPENAGLVQHSREMREALLSVQENSGMLSSQAVTELRTTRPNYSHTIETNDYDVINGQTVPLTNWQKFQRALTRESTVKPDNRRPAEDLATTNQRTQLAGPNQRLSPFLSNAIAVREALERAYSNHLTREYVQSIEQSPLQHSMVRLRDNQNPPKDSGLVEFYERGEVRRYAAEPMVAEALRFDPYASTKWLAIGKNLAQSLTTGKYNPLYVITSTGMGAQLASVTRGRALRVGYTDQVVQAMSGGRMGAPGSLVGTLAASVVNVVKAGRADGIMRATQQLERALLDDPQNLFNVQNIDQALGGNYVRRLSQGISVGHNTVLQDLVDNGRRLYAETPKGIGNRIGALHSSANELSRDVNTYASQQMKDRFIREMGVEEGGWLHQRWVDYGHLIMNGHDSVKLGAIDLNKGRISDRELGFEVRRLEGDLGQRGRGFGDANYKLADDTSFAGRMATKSVSNKPVGSLLDWGRDATLYINPHIQGVTRVLEAIANNPASTMGGIVAAVTVPHLASLSAAAALGPEYVDYLLNRREEWRKTNYVYVPIPGAKPEDGMNFRVDPALSIFGYPVLEAMDAVFGIRGHVARQLKGEAIPQEATGVATALYDGLKEFVGVSAPWPWQMAQAAKGFSGRNVLDPSFQRRTEQASGTMGSGMTTSSVLTQDVQMAVESIVGIVGKAGMHALDAAVSTGPNDSRLASAVQQFKHDYRKQVPFFGSNTYGASATSLGQNTRERINAARKIYKALQVQNAGLNITKTDKPDEGKLAVPNIKQGYRGEVLIPDQVKQQYDVAKTLVAPTGPLGQYFTERKRISDALEGFRGLNAGNINRHVVVPLTSPIDGLNYVIVHRELLKKQGAKELYQLENPEMTAGSKPGAKRTVEPREKKVQPAKPVADRTGTIFTEDEIKKLPIPSLKQVDQMNKLLNNRRYNLDKDAAAIINTMEQKSGIKLKDLAGQIKINGDVGSDDSEND